VNVCKRVKFIYICSEKPLACFMAKTVVKFDNLKGTLCKSHHTTVQSVMISSTYLTTQFNSCHNAEYPFNVLLILKLLFMNIFNFIFIQKIATESLTL